jgi:hypothetical protein
LSAAAVRSPQSEHGAAAATAADIAPAAHSAQTLLSLDLVIAILLLFIA